MPNKPAVTITRTATKNDKLVYVGLANRMIQYTKGSSRIVYIGTTGEGASRIAASAAHKAGALLGNHGITHLEFYVVTSSIKNGVQTWKSLERGLLITFREMFGAAPLENKTGQGMKWREDDNLFSRPRLKTVIEKYSKLKPAI